MTLSVDPMSEPTPDAMRREVLAAIEVVLSSATTTFAELLALLIESRSLDRTQLEGAFRIAEDSLVREGLGKTPLASALIPSLRARLDEIVEDLRRRQP